MDTQETQDSGSKQGEMNQVDLGHFDQMTNPVVSVHKYTESLSTKFELMQTKPPDEPPSESCIQSLLNDVTDGTELLKKSNMFMQTYMDAVTSLRGIIGNISKLVAEKLKKQFVPFIPGGYIKQNIQLYMYE